MINNDILKTEIKAWKLEKHVSYVLFIELNNIIEAVISIFGKKLNREDAINDCWIFTLLLLPKVKLKMNISSYIFTSLRHYMSDLKGIQQRHTYKSIDDIPEPESKK
jgi:hypothetical protein